MKLISIFFDSAVLLSQKSTIDLSARFGSPPIRRPPVPRNENDFVSQTTILKRLHTFSCLLMKFRGSNSSVVLILRPLRRSSVWNQPPVESPVPAESPIAVASYCGLRPWKLSSETYRFEGNLSPARPHLIHLTFRIVDPPIFNICNIYSYPAAIMKHFASTQCLSPTCFSELLLQPKINKWCRKWVFDFRLLLLFLLRQISANVDFRAARIACRQDSLAVMERQIFRSVTATVIRAEQLRKSSIDKR